MPNYSRREFLILSAVSGAGMLAAHTLPSVLEGPPLKVGIIGTAQKCRDLVESIRDLSGSRIAALSYVSLNRTDSLQVRMNSTAGITAYADPHALISHEGIDFLILSVPADRQGDLLSHALERGLHTLVETPLAPCLPFSQRTGERLCLQLLPQNVLMSTCSPTFAQGSEGFDSVEIDHIATSDATWDSARHIQQWLAHECGDALDVGAELLEVGNPNDCAVATVTDSARRTHTFTVRYLYKSAQKRKRMIASVTVPWEHDNNAATLIPTSHSTLSARRNGGSFRTQLVPRTGDITTIYLRNFAEAARQKDQGTLLHPLEASLPRIQKHTSRAAERYKTHPLRYA